jgi:hypothetical protein
MDHVSPFIQCGYAPLKTICFSLKNENDLLKTFVKPMAVGKYNLVPWLQELTITPNPHAASGSNDALESLSGVDAIHMNPFRSPGH